MREVVTGAVPEQHEDAARDLARLVARFDANIEQPADGTARVREELARHVARREDVVERDRRARAVRHPGVARGLLVLSHGQT
jgi:hypothetical protein